MRKSFLTRSFVGLFVVALVLGSVGTALASEPWAEVVLNPTTTSFTGHNRYIENGFVGGCLSSELDYYLGAGASIVNPANTGAQAFGWTSLRDDANVVVKGPGGDVVYDSKNIWLASADRIDFRYGPTSATALTVYEAISRLNTEIAFQATVAGRYQVLLSRQASALADAGQGVNGAAWEYASAQAALNEEFSFWLDVLAKAPSPRTSEPTSEHVVFHELPPTTWWCDLYQVELNGTLTKISSLQPASQLPSPVHADLSVHGTKACWYLMVAHDRAGTVLATKVFTVNFTNSRGLQEYWLSSMADVSLLTK